MFLLNSKIPLALPLTLLSWILGATSAHAITLREYQTSNGKISEEGNTGTVLATTNDENLLGDTVDNGQNTLANISCSTNDFNFSSGYECSGDYPDQGDADPTRDESFNFENTPYIEFSFEPRSGFTYGIDALSFSLKDSGKNDPSKVAMFSNIQGFSPGEQLGNQSNISLQVKTKNGTTDETDGIIELTSNNSNSQLVTLTLNQTFQNLNDKTTFRIYGYGANSKNSENLVIAPNETSGTAFAQGSTQQAVPFEAEGTMGLIALGGYFLYRNYRKRKQASTTDSDA